MASFYIYDISFLVIFSLLVGIFLYRKRHNLKREGIMYLYRTRVGIKFIDYVGTKYKRALSVYGFLGVVVGYILMVAMMYFLYKLVYIYLFVPEVVRAIKIPPLIPLIPYLPEAFKISFLPPLYFTYWIIAIAVIAIFHEFAHGIIARRYNIRILTTGFGFLGPFLAAFVEPDEKEMEEKSKYQQLAVLSAGVFTNLILAVLFFLLLSGFFVLAYAPAGYLFNDYAIVAIGVSSISMIGGKLVDDPTGSELLKLIEENGLEDDLVLGGNGNELKLTKIIANGNNYYRNIDTIKSQLDPDRLEVTGDHISLYGDFPAINAGLRGVVIKVNNNIINDIEDMSLIMSSFSPGEEIKITTKDKDEILEYDLILQEDPNIPGRAIIGTRFSPSNERALGQITNLFNFFDKPATKYEPRFNADFVLFIYNLIWWLALINLSVALVNMWPVAIFDGGRFFMLSVWAITGSEKFAMKAFKFMTYLILVALFLLMFGWFIAIF